MGSARVGSLIIAKNINISGTDKEDTLWMTEIRFSELFCPSLISHTWV
jgi:hypothetical protein